MPEYKRGKCKLEYFIKAKESKMNLYRQIKLFFLCRKRKRLQRERDELERLAMWLQIMGAITFTIGCAFEKPDNSLQSQLRRAIEKEDYERAAVLRDKIKQK